MNTLLRAHVVFTFCACVAGCAAPGESPVTTTTAASIRTTTNAARTARDAITIGKSTKADVIAALGKTTVINFDSGFEVWVYKYKADTPTKASWAERIGFARSNEKMPDTTEFVVLFAPSGVVTKARLRDAPPPADAKER
jgi:outer membrane protein assembly factor BamE (lipoprotein component of BamABCDE complex)